MIVVSTLASNDIVQETDQCKFEMLKVLREEMNTKNMKVSYNGENYQELKNTMCMDVVLRPNGSPLISVQVNANTELRCKDQASQQ